MYKLSNYNFYIPNINYDNISLIYNSLSNSLCETSSEKTEKIEKINGTNFDLHQLDFLDYEEKQLMLKNNMIVESDINEKNLVADLISNQKQINKRIGSFSIIFLPTNSCNMDCPYCFEGSKSDENNFHIMDEKILIKLLNILEKEFNNPLTNTIRRLHVEWYGGEPLLAPDIIKRFSEKLIVFAESRSLYYQGKMFTNGTLLTREKWDLLQNCKINIVQVTLDGDNTVHNKKRPLCNKKNSYYTILENLQHIPDQIHVSLRINIDKEILPTIDSLLDDLEKYNIWPQKNRHVRPYFGYKDFYETGYTEEKGLYYNPKEYWKIENEFNQKLVSRYNAWAQNNNINKIATRRIDYPRRGSYTCTLADLPYGIVIGEKGDVRKCMTPVNEPDEKLAHIDNLNFSLLQHNKWADFDRMSVPQCANCKVLPICTEDCTQRFFRNHLKCPSWKYFLKEKIVSYYNNNLTS